MKLSKAQEKVLRLMAEGTDMVWSVKQGRFCVGMFTWIHANTAYALIDREWVGQATNFRGRSCWYITDAGREQIESSPAGGR